MEEDKKIDTIKFEAMKVLSLKLKRSPEFIITLCPSDYLVQQSESITFIQTYLQLIKIVEDRLGIYYLCYY